MPLSSIRSDPMVVVTSRTGASFSLTVERSGTMTVAVDGGPPLPASGFQLLPVPQSWSPLSLSHVNTFH